jgi:catechol 2,3-dioxygenase
VPFDGLPAETEMGHVQLRVTDSALAATEPFYCDLLGFEVEGRLGNMFLAVGVADHRALLVFTNRFSLDGSEPAPEDSARLLGVYPTFGVTGMQLRECADMDAAEAMPRDHTVR